RPETFSADYLFLPGFLPEESACFRLNRNQLLCVFLALTALTYGLTHWPQPALFWVNLTVTVFYLAFTIYKVVLIWPVSGNENERQRNSCQNQVALLEDLPVYTILVPLYQEAEMVRETISALDRLDYPAECLDIKLLLEADDISTIEALRKINPGPSYEVMVLPPGLPRTKPRACNEGLKQARGKYLVIYDAEDRPEPDQLKKAVLAFEEAAPEVACFQARLNFYNASQNLLTTWFTAEYSTWFDLYLPGLARLEAPVPLGGTSNHFRMDVLKAIGGWDPFNVAEDCDLGIRLYRRGWRTRILESTTWEEACSRLSDWWRQRSRWVKGYLQTYLVHLRHPGKLLRELGWLNTLHFHFTVGGLLFCLLLNPVYWSLTVFWLATRSQWLCSFFPPAVFFLSGFCLFVGNFVFVYTSALAVFRRGQDRLVFPALFIPVYWLLMSLASWKGFWQFFFRPFHWEKTTHGLSRERTSR
ncbi:MAG TPA: glycosyltransferase, partial [bacterium]|nr:glycosyltransferase [bacterium]